MSRVVLALLLSGYAISLSFLAPEQGSDHTGGDRVVVVPPRGKGTGVVYRRVTFRGSPVELLDVDLGTRGVSVRVHARRVVPGGGAWRIADAFSLPVWCRLTGAVGGINGGFFGAEVEPGRKEVIGLAQVDGTLLAPAARYRSRGPRRVRYSHSALGIDPYGEPQIAWVGGSRRRARHLLCFDRPEAPQEERSWQTRSAVAGGPRLIRAGEVAVAAQAERLASPGLRARAFVGYAPARSGRRRVVLATAMAFTYRDAAEFLADYFRREYYTRCEEAMCLDGGTSAQLAYRQAGRCLSAGPGAEAVPTCVLVHAEP
jgi:phosphodiester glycosidase